MTLEEAKDILKKEFAVINLHKSTEPFEFDDSNWFGYEKPSVLEAFRVLSKEGYYITISGHDYDMRKKRLEKEYEKNTKAPGSAENLIKEDSGVNPALAEAASQFNDALLDEQAKKIKELTEENEDWKSWHEMQNRGIALSNIAFRNEKNRLGKEIARLNKIIHKKNLKIEELGKESSRHLEGKMKMFGENFDLEQKLKDKDAVLSDVAEELRLSKIREKNLTELSQKYMKENEELKEKLANKVVDKIDAQALKSAESALAWKEKLIYYKDMAIADLRKELKAQKGLVNHISKKYDGAKINLNLRMKECEKLEEALDEANKHQQQAYRSCTDKNNEIRALKLQISALEKRGNGIDWKRNADAIKLYVNRASHERLWNPISQDICNEKELSFIINHGGKRVKYALHFDGTDIVYECSDPDKKNNDQMVGADIAEEGGDLSGAIVLCGKDFIDAIKKMK